MLSILAATVCVNAAVVDPDQLLSFLRRHEQDLLRTGRAIVQQESGNDPNAYRACEDAAGIFQIRPAYLADVNTALGREHYRLADRFDPDKSWEMYMLYMAIHVRNLPRQGPEQFARCHNGGPKGYMRRCTLGYWQDIQRRMQQSTTK